MFISLRDNAGVEKVKWNHVTWFVRAASSSFYHSVSLCITMYHSLHVAINKCIN